MTAKVKLGPVLPLHKVNPNAVRSFLILMMSRAHSPSGCLAAYAVTTVCPALSELLRGKANSRMLPKLMPPAAVGFQGNLFRPVQRY
jgi:hypothetical protein